MCNITLIDTKDAILTARDVREITVINSLLGNTDGFGYALFSDHKVIKTKEEACIYWRENYKNFVNNENYSGIYHVRKSSGATSAYGTVYTTIPDKTISDDKSHPFDYGDIIVAHNGFLTFRHQHINALKYEKFIVGDLIDSQKFAIVLSKVCEQGKVTFENIETALNMFGGAYCLAIKGKLDNYAWLCRGKDRILYEMTIFYEQKQVGMIVNTTTTSLYLIGEFLLDYGYDYSITELKENTIYKYVLDSYNLEEAGKVVQDSPYDVYTKNYIEGTYKDTKDKSVKVNETIYEDIFDMMYGMGLLINDLVILSEIVIGKPILIFDDNDFLEFKVFLQKLELEAHNSRISLWGELQKYKNGSVANLYKDIHYPFLLNSKDELKHLLHNLEDKSKKEKANELLIL